MKLPENFVGTSGVNTIVVHKTTYEERTKIYEAGRIPPENERIDFEVESFVIKDANEFVEFGSQFYRFGKRWQAVDIRRFPQYESQLVAAAQIDDEGHIIPC